MFTSKKIFLLISFYAIFSIGMCQKIFISGYVYDIQSHESLVGANVWDNETKQATTTNNFGFFNLSLQTLKLKLPLKIICSFVGYQRDTIIINQTKDTILHINLKSNNNLKEINIISQKVPIEAQTKSGIVSIPILQIQSLPTFGGEKDIIKAYQLMPGVQQGKEGISTLLVRGGSADQNLILLDDVPLYYINHLGGFVSLFNDDAINSTRLYKGGFPASYGGRLSSVMDVRMKDGSNDKINGNICIGLISSKISIEGPIKKDTSTFFISARRFMYDLLSKPITKHNLNNAIGYTFYDINLKYNYILSKKNRLYFSLYQGDDKLSSKYYDKKTQDKSDFKQKWGNTLLALRWNQIYRNNLFGNTTLSYTKYRFLNNIYNKNKDSTDSYDNNYSFFSGINDLSIKNNLELLLSQKVKLELGLTAMQQSFSPCNVSYSSNINGVSIIDTTLNNTKLNGFQESVYFDSEVKLKKLTINAGFRLVNYTIQNTNFPFIEPRIQLHYSLPFSSAIKCSYTQMNQYIHLLTGSSDDMPIEFWVPATLKAKPSNSQQLSFSFVKTLFKNYDLSIELYKKNYTNLITYKEGVSYFSTDKSWEEKIENNGKGLVYGMEFLLQKQSGKNKGWISYTLSKNTRTFSNINNGKTYPDINDRRHQLNLVFIRTFNERIDFSFNWIFQTGQPIDLPLAYYYIPDGNNFYQLQSIKIYGEKNSLRALPYHRLDVGVNFKKTKKHGIRTWNISVYNLYNRKNPYYYYFKNTNYSNINTGKMVLVQKSLFPIMPSISYSFKF